jgi:hypothetical protein
LRQYGYALDVNKIYSNDIGAIRKCYGVEAARAAIMREVSGVFKVYGIAVDMRHLSLIADYMVCQTPPPFTPPPSYICPSLPTAGLPTLDPRGQIVWYPAMIGSIAHFASASYHRLSSPSLPRVSWRVACLSSPPFFIVSPIIRTLTRDKHAGYEATFGDLQCCPGMYPNSIPISPTDIRGSIQAVQPHRH